MAVSTSPHCTHIVIHSCHFTGRAAARENRRSGGNRRFDRDRDRAHRRDDREKRESVKSDDKDTNEEREKRKRSRSPRREDSTTRRSSSPPRRRPRVVPRYVVQVPKVTLNM